MFLNKWLSEINDTDDQKKRIASAKKGACTPLSIDKENCCGKFCGSSGSYDTTFESCTCVDFKRRKLPCKHIYRLAIELGYLDESSVTDSRLIKGHLPSSKTLSEAIEIIDQLNNESKELLYLVLYNILYNNPKQHNGIDYYAVESSSCIETLIEKNILESTIPDIESLKMTFNRKNLNNELSKLGYTEYKKSMSLDNIVQWVRENVSTEDIEKLINIGISDRYIAVRVSQPYLNVLRKIYSHLKQATATVYYL